jgi:hypothetical protein
MERKITQSEQKLINYLDDFIASDFFQEEVAKARKELDISSNKSIPEDDVRKERNFTIDKFLKKVIKKIPVATYEVKEILLHYLHFNSKNYKILNGQYNKGGLCRVEDVYAPLFNPEAYSSYEEIVQSLKRKFEYYPIVIKINPAASQKDLIYFIKDSWDFIQPYLEDYRAESSLLGKSKKKKEGVRERNDFIYKHQNLSLKEISTLLSKKTRGMSKKDMNIWHIDQGYISKIISMENKRRKNVSPEEFM